MMTYKTVYNYFKNLQNTECPITSELVENGYRQTSGGYIEVAQELNIDNPTQWWHITSYCEAKIEQGDGDKTYRFTPCGELLVYMAEMSKAVGENKLKELVDEIINSGEIDNRRKWNKKIKELCWDSIKQTIGQ